MCFLTEPSMQYKDSYIEAGREMQGERRHLTCDENNIGSKKIIEHNGGQFENEVEVEGSSVKKLRYWIPLD